MILLVTNASQNIVDDLKKMAMSFFRSSDKPSDSNQSQLIIVLTKFRRYEDFDVRTMWNGDYL